MSTGPLDGINVLEFSLVVAGPATGMHLSDMGANVIKVEAPGGEPYRNAAAVVQGHSKIFTWLNHGKQSLEINVRAPEGLAAIHRLIPNIDIVVINFRPGVPKRLGIDYETLSAIRPDLIYVDITGFGSKGPLAGRSASDIVAQAYGGAIASDAKVDEDGAPVSIGLSAGDLPTGMAATMGALAALHHRERTGEGQLVSASLLRSVLSLTGIASMREQASDSVAMEPAVEARERVIAGGGSYDDIIRMRNEDQRRARGTNLWYGGYRAKDGGLILGALTPANRDAMRRLLGIEGDDYDDPTFDARDPANLAKADELRDQVRAALLTRSVSHWIEAFDAVGAPVSPGALPGGPGVPTSTPG